MRWKFGPARRKWPGWKFSKKGDLEIIIPRWTAAAVVAGMVLIGGAGPVSTVLSVQEKLPADTAIHSVEQRDYIQKKLDEELSRLNLSKEHLREFKVNRLANTNDPAGRAVQLHGRIFSLRPINRTYATSKSMRRPSIAGIRADVAIVKEALNWRSCSLVRL